MKLLPRFDVKFRVKRSDYRLIPRSVTQYGGVIRTKWTLVKMKSSAQRKAAKK